MRKSIILLLASCWISAISISQAQTLSSLTEGVSLNLEASTTTSTGDYAPLWLSSNRQGLISPYANSSYERVGLFRDASTDSVKKWRIGYGLDITLNQNAQTKLFAHQAYLEIQRNIFTLTLGSKEREIDLRNNQLTSGGLSLGINAQPIPMARLDIDYFSVPGTHDWLQLKGRIGYGMTTDGSWQKNWVENTSTRRYTSNILYHEKAGYLKIGKETASIPLILEAGIQMFTQFGGTNYNAQGRGIDDHSDIVNKENLSAFWHAFWPFGSSDTTDGTMSNVAGNMLGSWNMAISWKQNDWMLRGYFEHFFEDHSQLFTQYGVYDHLLGFETKLPSNPYVSNIVIEHISSKDQSGAVYHDNTSTMPEQISARDNYYNHIIYSGWQNYGMAMGSPLLTSPIYNKLHTLHFQNNRVQAWHFGLSGAPSKEISWRTMFTWTKNWGTYCSGWDPTIETHFLGEINYMPRWAETWSGTIATSYSHGSIIGNTEGIQLTIRKAISL